ncbi:TIGR02678 family protein [Leekyejoonella antrihumi]|uniref:TIGR02678 family protein n=1 Tax=Leekyejoonella antrihumi TaxID=1660198 RepID=A0A563E8L8_9MICO|nr:TIGR02678 family protein [Leekyejoonella antrihumi]TWP38551.1 TIGR02678 family protein [Leekyejoonella antrihumi]
MTTQPPATSEQARPVTDPYVQAEVRTAARALLRSPLLYPGGGQDEELRLVRRHREELTRLFGDGLGYRLLVEPGFARLVKTGLGRDASRGLSRRNGTAFDPRRYAMLSLTVAALGRTRSQLLIDELVAQVRSAAADAGVDVDLDAIADRRALHSALVALIDLGVLSERDGHVDDWIEGRKDTLLDVHRDRLGVLVAAPLGGCDSADEVVAVASVPSAAGGARVAVRRTLTERPMLSTEDLTEEQREWWRRNRNREREWFQAALGLEVELRAEGAMAIDPDGDLTDLTFPGPGSAKHYALLLLAGVVDEIRATLGKTAYGQAWVPQPAAVVQRVGDEVFASWRDGFRKAHREDPAALHREALDVLRDAGLIRWEHGSVLVHAAAARYAPRPTLVEASSTGMPSLFDEES